MLRIHSTIIHHHISNLSCIHHPSSSTNPSSTPHPSSTNPSSSHHPHIILQPIFCPSLNINHHQFIICPSTIISTNSSSINHSSKIHHLPITHHSSIIHYHSSSYIQLPLIKTMLGSTHPPLIIIYPSPIIIHTYTSSTNPSSIHNLPILTQSNPPPINPSTHPPSIHQP